MRRKHVYGPVPSRRFGLSLGVDVVPHKVCTLDCIYCQVGPTTRLTLARECFVPPDEVVEDVLEALQKGPSPNIITFAGSGEPTLYSELGSVARRLKEASSIPLLLITNGTLLFRPDVAADAMLFDRVAPSLDAADPATFRLINQPHPDLDLPTVIQGLKDFRSAYKGEFDLELFFLEGVNDAPESVNALVQCVRDIAPSRVDLNTAVRPTPHRTVSKVSPEFLAGIEPRFSVPAHSVFAPPAPVSGIHQVVSAQSLEDTLLETLSRRPCTLDDLCAALHLPPTLVRPRLDALRQSGAITTEQRDAHVYYVRNIA